VAKPKSLRDLPNTENSSAKAEENVRAMINPTIKTNVSNFLFFITSSLLLFFVNGLRKQNKLPLLFTHKQLSIISIHLLSFIRFVRKKVILWIFFFTITLLHRGGDEKVVSPP